jgi:hypothetical protein
MVSELQGVADWQLKGVIAEGERATVYRAVRALTGDAAPVRALKLLHASLDDEELGPAVAAFRERTELARPLGHASVVAILDAGEVDGRPYHVSEWVEGVSLDTFPVKRTGRLKPEPAMVVLVDLLEALSGAFEQGLVHGRLDAGDLLLDDEGTVRLAGFGEEDSGQADFLAIAALAKELCASWPGLVEDWIESLEDGACTFESPAEALDAFPLSAFSRDALTQGRTILGRAVKRALTKRAESETAAGGTGAEDISAEVEAPAEGDLEVREDRFSLFTQRIVETRDAQDGEVLDSMLTQATRVAWLCAALLVVGVAIEVLRFTG